MDTTIQIRTNTKIKKAAQKVFKKQGVTMSSAFNYFLQEVAHANSFSRRERSIAKSSSKISSNWREQMEIDLKTRPRYNSAQEFLDSMRHH